MPRTRLPDFLMVPAAGAPEAKAPRWPRLRTTVRGMMLVVAINAFALFVMESGRWYQVHRRYREQAAFHSRLAIFFAEEERRERRGAEVEDYNNDEWKRRGDPLPPPGYRPDLARERAERNARQAEYFLRMKQKYELAARWPWLDVAPDPAPPR